MHEFNQSLKYDKRMYAADVKGSIAFSKALLKAGIVDEKEQKELERGLKEVEAEWRDGKVSLSVLSSLQTLESCCLTGEVVKDRCCFKWTTQSRRV